MHFIRSLRTTIISSLSPHPPHVLAPLRLQQLPVPRHVEDRPLQHCLVGPPVVEVRAQPSQGHLRTHAHSLPDLVLNVVQFLGCPFRHVDQLLVALYGLHGGDGEEVVGGLDLLHVDELLEFHAGHRLAETDDRLQLTHRDRDSVLEHLQPPLLGCLSSIFHVYILQSLGCYGAEAGTDLRPRVFYVLFEQLEGQVGLLVPYGFLLVEVQDVGGDSVVGLGVVDVVHDENTVKPRQDGRLEFDLLGEVFDLVQSAEDRVGCSEDAGSRVEAGGDAGLGHADGLLLHGLVDGHSVRRLHLVELVDADNTAICKDEGTTLNLELAAVVVLGDAGSQTSCGGALS